MQNIMIVQGMCGTYLTSGHKTSSFKKGVFLKHKNRNLKLPDSLITGRRLSTLDIHESDSFLHIKLQETFPAGFINVFLIQPYNFAVG